MKLLLQQNLIKDLWNQRSLIFLLASNDLKLRYKNSVMGFFWSFLEPLLMLAVLYIVFSIVIKNDIEHYPLYLLIGLIAWFMFARGTSLGQNSLLDKAGLLQQVYFRREIIVVSSTLTSFMMMILELVVFGVFLAIFGFIPPPTIVLLLPILIILFLLTLGFSLLLSVLTIYFRDLKFIWGVILQAGFFLSPIIYDINIFPENWRQILQLNPMVPLLDILHGAVLYNQIPTFNSITFLLVFTISILAVGLFVFNKSSKKIVEHI